MSRIVIRQTRFSEFLNCFLQHFNSFLSQRFSLILLPLLCIFFGVESTVSAQDRLQQIRARGTLMWGADQEGGGPFVYPASDDPTKLIGFEVELAELIANSIGVKADFQQGHWDKLPDLMGRGDLDLVLNGYEWNANRAARYGTSIPYYIYELQLLGNKSDQTLNSWEDLLNPADGRKRKVAVLGGSAAHEYLQSLGDKIEISVFEGVSDAMRSVELNVDGIDANLQDLPIWNFYQTGFPKLKAVDSPVGRGFYIAMTNPEEKELLQAVNQAILKALSDGSLRKLLTRYRMWNETQSLRALETSDFGNFVGQTESQLDASSGEVKDFDDGTTYIAEKGWHVIRQRGPLLLHAALMTVVLAFTSMPIAIFLGLIMALAKLSSNWFARTLSTLTIEIIRGTPLVLQLYVLFFLLPEIGIKVNSFWAAVAGLAINYSAYEAEIYRAGIQAIPQGQREAAAALGFSPFQSLRRIILPQATRIVIPPMTNDFIALYKDTAVCSVITVVELSKQYYIQARSTGAILELGILTAILYLCMSYPLSVAAVKLEQKLAGEKAV